MLDYCSSESSGGGYQNSSPTMNSFLNMNVGMDAGGRGQPAFVLSSPPLAALHNMTEMKTPCSSAGLMATQTAAQKAAAAAFYNATPHGINDILSRPAINALRLSGFNAAGMFLNSQARLPKLAELPGRPPIYWPGVLNANQWRANGNPYPCKL